MRRGRPRPPRQGKAARLKPFDKPPLPISLAMTSTPGHSELRHAGECRDPRVSSRERSRAWRAFARYHAVPPPGRSPLIAALRDGRWLHRNRIIAWGSMLLTAELLLVLVIAAWQHGLIGHFNAPVSSDFLSFYAAGKLALAGTPALAYDHAAHYLAEQQVAGTGVPYQFFFYPPVFLLPCAVLALLPYALAYALFEAGTLALFLLAMRAILRPSGWGWMLPVLAFPAVFWTIGLGQNAFLTAALFGGFTLLLDRRPVSAGLLLSAMCYKPHFGLLAPVALAAGGRWRAFAAAAAGVVGLVGASLWLFGGDIWTAYLHGFAASGSVYETGRIQFAGMVTPFGGMLLLGFGVWPAYAVQALATVSAAVLVGLVWRRSPDLSLRSAALLAGTLLAVPLALLYDQMLWLVALGWLVHAGRRDGFLPWEKLVLLACYPLILLTWPIATGLHVPLGPVESAALLLLVARRVWWHPVRQSGRQLEFGRSGSVATATP
ncbi:MAG TPA: glycosyltransferase family 87 protein [Acetobacteraceae bacterium]|nr:glycosyltransferase family 87 protein [Acetobacteraceae bacterium]